MDIRLTVRYQTIDYDCLCFSCAVKEAVAGKKVVAEVDDFSSDYDMRELYCNLCRARVDYKGD
jgi:hypothetical protein